MGVIAHTPQHSQPIPPLPSWERAGVRVVPSPQGQKIQKNFGIVVFPGSWSDGDCHHALDNVLGQKARYLWHKEESFSRR